LGKKKRSHFSRISLPAVWPEGFCFLFCLVWSALLEPSCLGALVANFLRLLLVWWPFEAFGTPGRPNFCPPPAGPLPCLKPLVLWCVLGFACSPVCLLPGNFLNKAQKFLPKETPGLKELGPKTNN